mmetsp:Transcript_50589/g.94762  ORF Transcript_50589/g.94762 Transcript_50589/m.94762 type:complete len:215 (+) Transcript_50589:1061-1705(+)
MSCKLRAVKMSRWKQKLSVLQGPLHSRRSFATFSWKADAPEDLHARLPMEKRSFRQARQSSRRPNTSLRKLEMLLACSRPSCAHSSRSRADVGKEISVVSLMASKSCEEARRAWLRAPEALMLARRVPWAVVSNASCVHSSWNKASARRAPCVISRTARVNFKVTKSSKPATCMLTQTKGYNLPTQRRCFADISSAASARRELHVPSHMESMSW